MPPDKMVTVYDNIRDMFGKSEKECDIHVQYNSLLLKAKNLSKHLGTPFGPHSMCTVICIVHRRFRKFLFDQPHHLYYLLVYYKVPLPF